MAKVSAIPATGQRGLIQRSRYSGMVRDPGDKGLLFPGKTLTPCQVPLSLQPKLAIGRPDDPSEQEADRVAEQVMRMPTPGVHRTCRGCKTGVDDENLLRRKATPVSPGPAGFPYSSGDLPPTRGNPLDPSIRAFFEPRFGFNFSHVRIHADSNSRRLSKELHADAFTHGRDIYFGEGRYDFATSPGKKLLAHELTHVIQQNQAVFGSGRAQIQLRPDLRQGSRTRTISIRWHHDFDIFRQRMRSLLVRNLDVPSAWVDQLVHVGNLRSVYTGLDSAEPLRRNDTRVAIRVEYHGGGSVGNSDIVFSVSQAPSPGRVVRPAEPGTGIPAGARTQVAQVPVPPEPEMPRPGETLQERLRRQARTLTRVLSEVVADTDREGYTGITITIRHTGDELSPGFAKHEPRQRRRAGTVPVSAASIARQYLQYHTEWVLMGGAADYRIEFARDEQGHMDFRSFRRIEPSQPGSGGGEDDISGIPDRMELYGRIFQQAERQLREAGIMLAGIAAREIILWAVGGVILRGLGLLGRAGLRSFASLRAALQSRQAAVEIGRAIQTLARNEADDFARIMRKVQNNDTLTEWEMGRLQELLGRIDSALGRTAVTTIVRTFRFVTPQVWMYSGREIVVLETSQGVQAFYRRTGLGPGRPVGHAGAQAGDWAPFDGFFAGDLAKSRYYEGIPSGSPLYGFGNQEFAEASQWLARQTLPAAREVGENWRLIQLELQRLGARIAMHLE